MGRILAVFLLAATSACGSASPAPSPARVADEPTADALFAAGRLTHAIQAYDREITRAEAPDAPRLRVLRALVRIAQGTPAARDLGFEELRAVEHAAPRSLWGRIARLFVDEIARGTVLREAVMQAGVDVQVLESTLARLREELATALEQNEEHAAALEALKADRARVAGTLREAEERAAAQAERVVELEKELKALKRIDMQRQP
jgi:hypothetical protein